MPAVMAPAPGGILYWHVLELLHGLAKKARIVGFDLVEFMPARDPTGVAALTAARIVCNAIGATRHPAPDLYPWPATFWYARRRL